MTAIKGKVNLNGLRTLNNTLEQITAVEQEVADRYADRTAELQKELNDHLAWVAEATANAIENMSLPDKESVLADIEAERGMIEAAAKKLLEDELVEVPGNSVRAEDGSLVSFKKKNTVTIPRGKEQEVIKLLAREKRWSGLKLATNTQLLKELEGMDQAELELAIQANHVKIERGYTVSITLK